MKLIKDITYTFWNLFFRKISNLIVILSNYKNIHVLYRLEYIERIERIERINIIRIIFKLEYQKCCEF